MVKTKQTGPRRRSLDLGDQTRGASEWWRFLGAPDSHEPAGGPVPEFSGGPEMLRMGGPVSSTFTSEPAGGGTDSWSAS